MGAVLGIAAHGRTKEKIAVTETSATSKDDDDNRVYTPKE
jgi:D-lyxose ketol-isomerase